MSRFEVVVCGGGIAGIEALLRLRRLAGDRVGLTLVSPEPDLMYRPLAVGEPFALGELSGLPLERVAADTSARWLRDRVVAVDAVAREVETGSHGSLRYDALLLAIGARESPPFEHAVVFSDRHGIGRVRQILRDVDAGAVRTVAFVLAGGPVWPLPLYELALLTAERARRSERALRIALVTPDAVPLKVFGPAASEAIVRLAREYRVELHTGAEARVPSATEVIAGATTIAAERIVTLPRVSGAGLTGVPAGGRWFIPIDDRCRVPGLDGRVFAAGDATDFVVKHGSVAAQQADTAAAGIAHLAGSAERPPPLRPTIRGMLLTGRRPLYLAARLVDGRGWRSEVFTDPPWPAGHKVVADELGPYLDRALIRRAPG